MTQRTYAYRQGDRWVEITGAWASMLGDHAPGWIDTATPAERQQAGAVEIVDGQLVPHPHQMKMAEEVADQNGVPTRRGIFVDLTVDERKAELTAALRTAWHVHEVSGLTGPSGRIATDGPVQRRLLVALASFGFKNPDDRITWEIRAGEFASVTEPQLRGVAAVVFGHVAVCADQARGLQGLIDKAKTHAQLSAIDLEAGWPP